MESLFSFPVGLFHPLQHAGLSRRTRIPALPYLLPEHFQDSEGILVWAISRPEPRPCHVSRDYTLCQISA